jgi:hypothetical protein
MATIRNSKSSFHGGTNSVGHNRSISRLAMAIQVCCHHEYACFLVLGARWLAN